MPIDLDAVQKPITHARGLPNAHYTDPDVFTRERARLIEDTWAGLAVAADVPEPGDAKPIDFMGMPLLLLRDTGGDVRVFHNVCRHRGMILVDRPGKIKGVLRCPYHSWCYAPDGRLVTTPYVGGPDRNTDPAIHRDDLGLLQVRSHIYRDVVFINISGQAPDFKTANQDLIARWSAHDHPLYHGGADSCFTLDLACNWKLAVENYCESYHLPWVHPGLNSYSRLEDHYHIEHPGQFSGQGTHVYRQFEGENGPAFPDFPNLSPQWQQGAEYIALFPNVLFGVQRDHAFAIILHPIAPGRTLEHIHLYYASAQTDPAHRARNTAQWKTVFTEDIQVVEGMQRGRHAPAFDGGRFSPAMDGPTHLFHQWVAQRLV
jgi:choline monooxygenase